MICIQIGLFPFFKSRLYSSLLIDVFVLKIKTPDQIVRMRETCRVSSNYNRSFFLSEHILLFMPILHHSLIHDFPKTMRQLIS
jgi:hypothetical protein